MLTEKNMERKLRRALTKQGFQLHKSRNRNWSCDNQLGYMISKNGWVECGERFDLTLADVEAFANS